MQNNVHILDKTINVQLKNVSLSDDLEAISQQADCSFGHDATALNSGKTVSIDYKNITVRDSLKKLLGNFAKVQIRGEQVFIQTFDGGRGTIKGRILSSDGQPASYVPVGLKETGYGTTTDESGNYQFKAPAGTYTLLVQFVGYEPEEKQVEIKEGEVTVIGDFTLRESAQQLQEVIVEGNRNRFAKRESQNVARLPLKYLENPQVYNTVTKELAQEQIAVDYRSMTKNAPGVGGQNGQFATGRTPLIIRGFDQSFVLRNGVLVNSNLAIDPVTIEKIEIIKGPSATLFGGTGLFMGYGGLVNQQTKKPFENFGGEAGYSFGSYELSRIYADVNTPLNKEKTTLFRLNTSFHNEGAFRDAGFVRSFNISPYFLFKVNEKLTIQFELDIYKYDLHTPLMLVPSPENLTAKSWADIKLPYNRAFTSNDVFSKYFYTNTFAKAEYKISDKWKSETNISYSKSRFELHNLLITVVSDSTLTRSADLRSPSNPNVTAIQQNFIFDGNIGKFKNKLLTGGDYSSYSFSGYQNFTTIDTVNYLTQSAKYINFSEFEQQANAVQPTYFSNTIKNYGLYFTNVFYFTKKLSALIGLRYNYLDDGGYVEQNGVVTESFKQGNFSPKFGLVYQPIKDKVSLFVNYQNGFTNVNGRNANNQPFVPEQANQVEFGIKSELAKGLSGSLSYYNIKVTNIARTDPSNPSFLVQDGDQFSKGFEADVIANPIAGLQILAGYGYNDSNYSRSDSDIEGKRPANIARHLVNTWISYRMPSGKAKGIGLGIGGNYSSESFVNDVNTFILPAYTLLDATVFYDQLKYRMGLKVNNFTNEQSWNRFGPQPLRQIIANFTVKF